MSRAVLATLTYAPRGLSREEAARYVGISPSKFDQLVTARAMPEPRRVGTRKVWDRQELDLAFDELPRDIEHAPNSWEDVP